MMRMEKRSELELGASMQVSPSASSYSSALC